MLSQVLLIGGCKIKALLTTDDALFLHYFPQIEVY